MTRDKLTKANQSIEKALMVIEVLAHPVSYTHLTLPTNREV